MEAIKDPQRVDKMFAQGEITTVDPDSKYRYSLVAKCPIDGDISNVSRYERQGKSLKTVSFKCARCFNVFEVPQDDIMII